MIDLPDRHMLEIPFVTHVVNMCTIWMVAMKNCPTFFNVDERANIMYFLDDVWNRTREMKYDRDATGMTIRVELPAIDTKSAMLHKVTGI